MKKLLIMAPLFYPQKNGGGPPVSVMNLIKCIHEKFEIYVISNNFETGQSDPLPGVTSDAWNTYSFGKVYYFGYGKNTVTNVYKLVCSIRPDVIYQNSFFSYNTALATLLYNRFHKTKAIIAPRGELCPGAFAMKKRKKQVYLAAAKLLGLLNRTYFHTTGDEETHDVKTLLKKKDCYFYNISNISLPENDAFLPIAKEKGSLRLVFAARVQKKKNLLFAIESLRELQGNVEFDVFGPLEEKEYWQQCENAIAKLPPNVTVRYCGQIEQKQMTDKIKEYHVFYMPTLSENYGHSIAESFFAYRPVVISDQTPWVKLASFGCGHSLDLNTPNVFTEVLQAYVDMEDEAYKAQCIAARKYVEMKLDISAITDKYIQMIDEVIV